MKLFARLHVVVVLFMSALLYTAWSLRSYHPITRAKKVWSRKSTHLVVFGDSWSTNRLEPSVPADRSAIPANRKLWVDALCSEVVCDHIYDLAQSLPSNPSHKRGPVIDNAIFARHTSSLNLTVGLGNIGDFGHQVDQYLAQDDVRWRDDVADPQQNSEGQTVTTIFTVLFGVWEIWDFAGLEQNAVVPAVQECVSAIFTQLDRLVQAKSLSWSSSAVPPTFILPKIPDPSFLPRWVQQRTSANGIDTYGRLQRQAVTLTNLWNHILEDQADKWINQGAAHLVMPDFNTWMLEQMRGPDMDETGLAAIWKASTAANHGGGGGGGGNAAAAAAKFTELELPCVNYTASSSYYQDEITTQPFSVCKDPSHYLFWDDTRLSGTAHELFGKHVSQILKNSTILG